MYPQYNPDLDGWQIVYGNGQLAHSSVFKTAGEADGIISKLTF